MYFKVRFQKLVYTLTLHYIKLISFYFIFALKQQQEFSLEYNVRTVEFGSINLDNYEDKDEDFYYIMFKPPNFDENKKYPLLVEVYSGKIFYTSFTRT